MMPRRAVLIVLGLAILLAMLGGCGGGRKRRQVRHDVQAHVPHFRPPTDKPDPSLIAAQERFACKLLPALAAEQPERNLFFSPASLSLALAMLCNGARGQTLAAVQSTLGLQGLGVAEVNAGYRTITQGLRLGADEPKVAIANALWADEKLRPEPGSSRSLTATMAPQSAASTSTTPSPRRTRSTAGPRARPGA